MPCVILLVLRLVCSGNDHSSSDMLLPYKGMCVISVVA